MSQLLSSMHEAGFGLDSNTVIDPAVRKALALEPSNFAMTKPIIGAATLNTIKQALMPRPDEIKAELYKLNVYGPGGHFKSHVDTPSKNMFGSLVVCLPSPFAGGEFVVRGPRDKEIVLDWGLNAHNLTQWVAFFSDCEHEIRPVTTGHRITLTYNLHLNGGESVATKSAEVNDIDDSLATFSPTPAGKSDPLNQLASIQKLKSKFKSSLANPNFKPKGGLIGLPCAYTYVQKLDGDSAPLSTRSLKGVDGVAYAVLKQLNLPVSIHRVIAKSNEVESEDDPTTQKYWRSPYVVVVPISYTDEGWEE
ncbi:hypothetical protein HDV00_003178 [Rhizophlyctis rosea]|nr:hypothetical protein HDV00_003178 [Rhizophlyctis rosea]